jgi:two-component system, cell cycle sensor histidine kinase and response regulator CckA
MTAAPTKILIVEDERIVARDIQRRLTRFGYQVVGVTGNGQVAAQLVKSVRPDLVLMDIHLEGASDGVSAAETIRADSGTPVVYLTAYADEQTLQRARVTEPFGYILKPFEERELRTVIEMALYRHGSERKLRESERRYAVTLASIGDAVIATDEQARITFMNPVAEALTGYSAAEASGKLLGDVFRIESEDTGEPLLNPVAKVLRTGTVTGLTNHCVLVARDGRRIPIDDSGAPIRADGDRPLGAVMVFHDISARRRSDEAIRKAEQKYRSIFENAIEGMFQVGDEGRLLTANPALARILGYDSPEALVASVGDFYQRLCADPVRRDEYQRTLDERGLVQGFEVQAARKDGSRAWVSLNVRKVLHPHTRTCLHEGAVEEISERIRLEEQFRQAQKMEAIGRLAGGVAHDFNNLLTVILSYCDLVLRADLPAGRVREDVGVIRDAAGSAAELTQQLLMFGRKQPRRPRPADLNQLVRGIERMLARLIGENIVLETALAPELWPVYADAGQMEQVVVNLAVNARDAMTTGGRLTISTQNVERSPLDALAEPDIPAGRYVILSLSDSGCGMDAATRARLFEPYFTTKEVGKGTGLGLATTYGIVKQSDGHVRVSSEVGQGSTFAIWLPASSEAPRARSPQVVEPEQRGRGGVVLVVDDDASIRRLVARVLEGHGFELLEAAGGAEALALSRAHAGPIDLLLTDVIMPEMDGLELARRLTAERPDTPVLYMSGYMEGLELGSGFDPDDVVGKPFTPSELVRRIEQRLAPARAARP